MTDQGKATEEPLLCLDKEEWWEVAQALTRDKPDREPATREEFDRAWDEFQEIKRRKAMM